MDHMFFDWDSWHQESVFNISILHTPSLVGRSWYLQC
jgi:hypothetical protein